MKKIVILFLKRVKFGNPLTLGLVPIDPVVSEKKIKM
jgi:hypothetical protein